MSLKPPADRYCDLVMKGGITSGVVYPPAIVKLASHYNFKNIGGTSAGAIAAALTAAAEFRRRETGSAQGFDLLAKLPKTLGDRGASKDTQLFRLFQPDASCARLFGILAQSLNASGTLHRISKVLRGCIQSYWLASIMSVLLAVAIRVGTGSLLAAFLLFLVALPVLVGFAIYRDATRSLVGNNYGMCKGMTTPKGVGPGLTDWLHQQIQTAAGLDMDTPLTFGHLWNAAGGPTRSAGGPAVRSIDLEMFTTNLSHGRPYMLPHVEPTARLFYRREELVPYLPTSVMTWFDDHAIDYQPSTLKAGSDPGIQKALALGLKEIPAPGDFPVLLAARMSLSFPVLFSAVPLWAIDYEHPTKERGFDRCLFSDGGISSNFPMHLFDGLVPQWPTFGFDLEAMIEDLPETFMPVSYLDGIADRWVQFDKQEKPASRFGGFLISIAGAMQNWNDNTQARSAGVRDRVVRVRLSKKEGGMNLNMEPKVIQRVADRGDLAADQLIARYLGEPPEGVEWDGWSQQRLSRLDVFLYALDQKLPALLRALGGDLPFATPYRELIRAAGARPPPGHAAPLDQAQQEALGKLIDALQGAAKAFEKATGDYPNQPLPEPELRARSVL